MVRVWDRLKIIYIDTSYVIGCKVINILLDLCLIGGCTLEEESEIPIKACILLLLQYWVYLFALFGYIVVNIDRNFLFSYQSTPQVV